MCIPNTLIYSFKEKMRLSPISLGAQNCHHEEKYGPYTGSVNASMLKSVGAEYVIIGHSERRQAGETNKILKKKIESALRKKLNVIFCIGETYKEKKLRKTFFVLAKQIRKSLDQKFDKNRIIIAYEPVWSIGTNKIPKIKELKNTVNFIKNNFKKSFKTNKPPIVLYGGSVNDKNINLFSSIHQIDGFLIGSASQSSKKFIDIIKKYYT
jgi:triosephosphate isomerase